MVIDTHCHINFPEYRGDLDQVLERAMKAGVEKIICVGADLKSSKESVDLAARYPQIYATVGIHPEELAEDERLNELRSLAKNKKVVAIGECGLDYHDRGTPINQALKDRQIAMFDKQLKLAQELDLPVVIHNREAHEDVVGVIKAYKGRGVMHCFSGTKAFLKEILDLGYYVGFDGNITFKNALDLRDRVGETPIERILIETDSPYLSPEPYRGARNEPARVKEVGSKIGQIKQIPLTRLEEITSANAKQVFRLD